MKKKYDAAVAVEKYTNREGQEKTRWQNVGSVMQNENGFFMFLDRTFNPAGVPNPDGKSNVIISFFEPKKPQSIPQGNSQYKQETVNDSDIPF